ncbi:signal peptide peptidase SppA [Candidatus Contendibacter odensensis]|uniref:Signal peptide peptidase SppA, 36K type n=1 Tax=Candidatus Contendobacter odensis Run_B_J11 TaxID=1400861 RepID=A0A7U7J4H9_9GAMM|nr:signal peptide peptidase SppA [Candidatus Contendobacter odensis]CDH45635.1 Signal peptide peptidase SppA, 36K type [Candidatus Contendobacter odensis Run_B_J11]
MTEANTNLNPKLPDDERWARDVLGKLALAAVTEQRRARRWGIFFKLLFFTYLVTLLVLVWPDSLGTTTASTKRHTALVRVEGLIASSTEASAKNVIEALRKAFKDEKTVGVIMEINSPGGSPVQAGEIYDEIQRLRQQYPKMPIHAVTSDVCASGGYYIAAAAQNIYANKASIVGSIGVRLDSFGFTDAIAKLGIERRAYTAGNNKDFLDPFKPVNPAEVQHLQGMLDAIHQQFITAVKQGRGERLKENPDLFSGLMWTGEQGVGLGLVDALGSTRYVAEEIIGEKNLLDYTKRTRWVDRLFDGAEASMGAVLMRVLGQEGMPQWR